MKYNVAISVLMPVYRAEKEYLKTAIYSILNQSFKDFELLLLYEPYDNDGLMSIMQKIEDSRIKIIIMPERCGLSQSLNFGLDSAMGKYIARMDADDIAINDRLYRQFIYMEAHPELAVLGGIVQVIGTKKLLFDNMIIPEVRKVRMMFENAGIAHPTAFMRTEFIKKNSLRYDESLKGSEDYALWVDIVSCNGLIDSLDEVILKYRVHELQASRKLSQEMQRWNNEIKIKQWKRCCPELTKRDLEILADFGRPSHSRYKAKEYRCSLQKLIKGNKKSCIALQVVFEKEILWQWLRYALYQIRKQQNGSLIFSWFSMKILIPRNFFFVKNCVFSLIKNRKE